MSNKNNNYTIIFFSPAKQTSGRESEIRCHRFTQDRQRRRRRTRVGTCRPARTRANSCHTTTSAAGGYPTGIPPFHRHRRSWMTPSTLGITCARASVIGVKKEKKNKSAEWCFVFRTCVRPTSKNRNILLVSHLADVSRLRERRKYRILSLSVDCYEKRTCVMANVRIHLPIYFQRENNGRRVFQGTLCFFELTITKILAC